MEKTMITNDDTSSDRRSLIIDAATKLFCQNGYSGTRMSDIAEAINVTKPIVYRYFSSKEELFAAWVDIVLVARRNEIVERIVNTEKSVKDEAYTILMNAVDGLSSPVILAPWRIAILESDNFPNVTQLIREKFKLPIFLTIKDLFEKGLKNKEVQGENSEILARLFCSPIAACASMFATFGLDYMSREETEHLFLAHHRSFFEMWSGKN